MRVLSPFTYRIPAVLLGLTFLGNLVGCADPFGHFSAMPNSYELEQEKVQVELLTKDTFRQAINEINTNYRLSQQVADPIPTGEATTATPISSLGGALVGAVIDAVKAEVEADAARRNHSFAGDVFVMDFWDMSPINPVTQKPKTYVVATVKYVGLRVRRFTKQHSSATNPAFDFLAFFDTSKDKQLFLVEPLFLQIRGSSAKLSADHEKLSISLTEHATWIDKDSKLQDVDLITSTWNAGTIKLQEPKVVVDREHTAFGKPIVAVPVSISAGQPKNVKGIPTDQTVPVSGGMCRFSVVVTETDPSDVQANEKFVATFLGSNKDTIIKAFSLTPPPAPATQLTTQKSPATQPASK